MSQLYSEDGKSLPVTLVKAGPITVTAVKTEERDGYTAVQVGYGTQRTALKSKSVRGHLGVTTDQKETFRYLKEFRLDGDEDIEKGKTFDVSVFQVGDMVTVRGVAKSKGFQGVVKRHNFRGGPASHGGKHNLRQPGSIGATWPQHVTKGRRMAGRMGGGPIVVRNLQVVHVDPKENVIAIKGALPGNNGTLIEIRGNRKTDES